MSEKPILFSDDMVRAILEGRKCMTRRVVKPQPQTVGDVYDGPKDAATALEFYQGAKLKCPYSVGDRLWVRETWAEFPANGDVIYRAEPALAGVAEKLIWRPSIFMPRWASRLTLEVTAVRVERLQDMRDVDVFDEGLQDAFTYDIDGQPWIGQGKAEPRRRKEFADLWDSLNAKRGHSWESNPWVWVIEFKVAPNA